MRVDRRGVLARSVPAADGGRDRLVAHRRVRRHDDRVPDDGHRLLRLGALTDRFGPLPVVLAGGILLGLGLALASRATSLLEFQLIYGLLVGGATGAVFVPTMTTVTGWFEKNRSLAVSLVSAGMGMAPMTISPFASWLITNYDWRTAQLVIAIVAWALLVPTAFLIRRAPPVIDVRERVAAAPGVTMGVADPGMTAGQALRSPQFWVLSVTYFCCCATH